VNVCQVGTAGSLEVEKKSLTSATPLTSFPLLRLFSSLGSTQAVKFLLRGGGFSPMKLVRRFSSDWFGITSSGHEKWFGIIWTGHEKWFDMIKSGHEGLASLRQVTK